MTTSRLLDVLTPGETLNVLVTSLTDAAEQLSSKTDYQTHVTHSDDGASLSVSITPKSAGLKSVLFVSEIQMQPGPGRTDRETQRFITERNRRLCEAAAMFTILANAGDVPPSNCARMFPDVSL